jgi:hypothetical protein
MKDLMHRTCIKSYHDKKRDAMLSGVLTTINQLFPSDPGAPGRPSCRLDHFPPPDYQILNYFTVAMVEKVSAENKRFDSAKQPEQHWSKKCRPDHLPPAPPKQTSKVPANIIWSVDQKVLIDTVEHYLDQLQEWRAEGRAQKRLPVARNGKTTTLSKITEMYAEYNLCSF